MVQSFEHLHRSLVFLSSFHSFHGFHGFHGTPTSPCEDGGEDLQGEDQGASLGEETGGDHRAAQHAHAGPPQPAAFGRGEDPGTLDGASAQPGGSFWAVWGRCFYSWKHQNVHKTYVKHVKNSGFPT